MVRILIESPFIKLDGFFVISLKLRILPPAVIFLGGTVIDRRNTRFTHNFNARVPPVKPNQRRRAAALQTGYKYPMAAVCQPLR